MLQVAYVDLAEGEDLPHLSGFGYLISSGVPTREGDTWDSMFVEDGFSDRHAAIAFKAIPFAFGGEDPFAVGEDDGSGVVIPFPGTLGTAADSSRLGLTVAWDTFDMPGSWRRWDDLAEPATIGYCDTSGLLLSALGSGGGGWRGEGSSITAPPPATGNEYGDDPTIGGVVAEYNVGEKVAAHDALFVRVTLAPSGSWSESQFAQVWVDGAVVWQYPMWEYTSLANTNEGEDACTQRYGSQWSDPGQNGLCVMRQQGWSGSWFAARDLCAQQNADLVAFRDTGDEQVSVFWRRRP